ncbi:MAG TPA: PfkB family carbohydrate kinase [Vicinamibacteria bacterium]|nr:PfkB family carbohydrate kinase [Vicinamibacteria bacterium]
MARILVVGSVARDEVVRLKEPLRAGSHLEAQPTRSRLGGGGANVAIPLAHAGHQVRLLAPLGSDLTGQELLRELLAEGVDTSALSTVAGLSTRSLVLLEPNGERTVVNLHRCREASPPERLRSLAADAVYVRSRALDLTPLLREKVEHSLVVAQLPPAEPGSRPAQVLVASESDFDGDLLADPWALGQRVAGPRLQWVVVTRGSRGAEAFGASEHIASTPLPTRVVDTTGAGDAFAAGLLHALVSGAPMAEALRTGVTWGSAAVAGEGSYLSRNALTSLLGVAPARG